jgi:hypothetical protein
VDIPESSPDSGVNELSTAFADFEYDTEFLEPDEEDQPEPDSIDPELRDVSDSDFVEEVKETQRARRYRIKTKHGLNFLIKLFAGNPKTVADAATIIYHGPDVAKAIGHLADTNDSARKFIDFVTDDGIDNPYIITALTVLPMVFQVMRNHEPALEKVGAGGIRLHIPFTKREIRLPIKLRIRLFRGARELTQAPETLTSHIFSNPAVREALAKQDIRIAWPPR